MKKKIFTKAKTLITVTHQRERRLLLVMLNTQNRTLHCTVPSKIKHKLLRATTATAAASGSRPRLHLFVSGFLSVRSFGS